MHLTLWFTLFQREIPEQMQSRVSSYDVLGSFVLMPIGFAIVGPLSDAIGVTETLWLSLGVMLTTWALILSLPSVWALKAPAADQTADAYTALMTVRVRMAPSPTGFLHIGGVRTFLFNWLFARGQGGECLLRIENTDTSREVAEAVGQIEESLRWLGIEWDGETRFQLDGAERCRIEAARLVAEGKAYEDDGAIRIRMPKEGVIGWDDAIKGRIEFPAAELEDMVILRSDGRPVYNFASPVDDWVDGITHVIRGDDHVSNTPKQIVVLEALGAALPIYAHAPNIFGDDGKKLSKRHGAQSIAEFRDAGYIAPALMNFLALLGWAPDGETTIMSRDELVERFTLERVGASPATFDYAKLDWMNGQYLRALDVDAYADALVTYLREQGIDWDEARIRAAAPIVQEKMGRLGEFPDFARFLFEDVEPDPGPARRGDPDPRRRRARAARAVGCAEPRGGPEAALRAPRREAEDGLPADPRRRHGLADLARALREPGAPRARRLARAAAARRGARCLDRRPPANNRNHPASLSGRASGVNRSSGGRART